jgi:hypothetical protein
LGVSERPRTCTFVIDPVSSGREKSWMPVPPPVHSAKRFAVDGIATAIANVAKARYRPESRSAGSPKARPTTPATTPAIGIVQTSFIPPEIGPPRLSLPAIRTAVVYPPMAMKAPWPSEIWPV